MSNVIISYTEEDFRTVIRDCVKAELSASRPIPINSEDADLITEKEAKEFLRVSKVTLKKWRDEKRIPFYRIGSRIRYKKSEIINSISTVKKYGRKA